MDSFRMPDTFAFWSSFTMIGAGGMSEVHAPPTPN
jgi:hypothetical protein